jgi:cytochrome P450
MTDASSPHPDPQGPPGIYGVRNTLRFASDPLSWLRSVADEYGDLVSTKVLGRPWFIVSHPDDIERILVKDARIMKREEGIAIVRRVLGQGLLTSEGDLWKRQRKLMSQAFSPKRIEAYAAAMVRVTDETLGEWRSGETANLHQEMSRITMKVVADVLFGESMDARDVEAVGGALEVLNEFFSASPEALLRVPKWVPTPRNVRVNRALATLDRVVYDIIARRRAGEQRDDLLGTLLSARDDDGGGMSDGQLRDEVMTLFLAGHETTSLALAHALYLLSKHPAIERRLHAETDAVLHGRLPTADDVRTLPFADCVLKETMRLYPPAWATGRETTEAYELRGTKIPKGAQLMASQWIVHRDARWFPNPEGFDPDRWSPERAKEVPRYAYFPFGGGPRVCIGNHFAMMEATLLLVLITQRFRVELLAGERLDLRPAVTLRQKGHGLRVRIVAREQQRPASRPRQDSGESMWTS